LLSALLQACILAAVIVGVEKLLGQKNVWLRGFLVGALIVGLQAIRKLFSNKSGAAKEKSGKGS
jgi:hypothetical protein